MPLSLYNRLIGLNFARAPYCVRGSHLFAPLCAYFAIIIILLRVRAGLGSCKLFDLFLISLLTLCQYSINIELSKGTEGDQFYGTIWNYKNNTIPIN